jgi:DNA-binding NarL/FixJ family response regulator
LRPDVVVMDVQIGADDGVDATAELTQMFPELRVVVLTAHADSLLMHRAGAAGACSLLPKDGSLPEFLAAVRSARPGGLAVHPTLLRLLMSSSPAGLVDVPLLTGREQDVLRLLATGMDTPAIADHLGISVHTCRGYAKGLLMKLDAHSQLEAVAIGARLGLVDGRQRR